MKVWTRDVLTRSDLKMPMSSDLQTQTDLPTTAAPSTTQPTADKADQEEPILCPHCRRTASNGIKCKGMCVADSDY